MANFEALGVQGTITQDYFDRMPQIITYNGDGTINTITATGVMQGVTVSWIKTFGYTSGKLTSISVWAEQ